MVPQPPCSPNPLHHNSKLELQSLEHYIQPHAPQTLPAHAPAECVAVSEVQSHLATPGDPTPLQQSASRLLSLPPELRNQIYSYLLCAATAAPARVLSTYDKRMPEGDGRIYPAILSTCRMVSCEATRLLYGRYIFTAHPQLLTGLPSLSLGTSAYSQSNSSSACSSLLGPILSPRVISLISHWRLTFRLDTDPNFSSSDATAQFSGAQYLEIQVWQAQFEACDSSALRLFEGVRNVGRARVWGSVERTFAGWLEGVMMSEANGGEVGA
ncbi:hypothetical protein K432DRAFT_297750 [Lepidopterella palustris CBS 459.81]|uniref:F-box domain-containing protein n=1 Tax=Lepidopterella palustris CBS 459.81 TaxID=1314670 RepID=A0A8E2EAG3_9PEZI|nr:hypothetical protein K432DRAFT_297750 [Lepidopterella palustris CBS 459.81]